jgi:hypothetical protein
MPSIPINNLTNKTDINGAELLPFVRDGKTFRCSVSGLFYNNVITTSKINNGAVTPAKLSTGGPSWDGVGGTLSLSQIAIELGNNITSNSNSYIDLHSSFPIIDYDTRIIRASGINGNLTFANRGTGNILLSANGNVGIGTLTPGAKLEVTGGSVDDSIPELRISGSSGNISTYVSLCAGFYNQIALNNDKGIIFTEGTVDTGNLVIAPHSTSIGGIRINSSGNVGIKKSSPTTALDVNGTVTATYVTLCSIPTSPSHATTKEYVDGRFTYGNSATLNPSLSTDYEFTGIPSNVNRITLMFNGVSINGSSQLAIVLGTNSGYETSNYVSSVSYDAGRFGSTSSFAITDSTAAANNYIGVIVLTRFVSEENSWHLTGTVSSPGNNYVHSSSGFKGLSSILDKIKLTTVGGSDKFDNRDGFATIMYEY